MWGVIRDRFISVSALLGTGFLLLVSLVLSAGLAAFGKWYGGWLPAPELVLHLLDIVMSQIVLFGAEFTQVYANEIGTRIVPTDKAVVADPSKAGSMQPMPEHSRPQSAAGGPALRHSSHHQPGEELPWWGTVLLLWVAVIRFPPRSQ